MKRQWIGREIDDDENDDPNPGPSTRANHAKRGRKPKLSLSPKKPTSKRRIKFTEGLNTSQGPMDHWLLRKMKSIVDLKEEIIEDILNPPEELPNITANNSFNGTNESEKTIKDNEEEKNIEMEIIEIGQPDENMEMEVDEGQEKAKEKVNKRKENEPPAQIYTDREGNEWTLLGPSGYLQVHYPLLGMEKCFETPKSTIYKCVHRYQQKCPHLMLMLKKKKLFYQRFEHSHQMETTLTDLLRGKTPSPKKVGPDVDLVNKMELDRWKCIDPAIASEEKLEQIIKDQGMKRAGPPNEIFQKFVCKEGRCGFKMRWLKRRSELWSIGEHNRHPRIVQRKLKRKKKREDKWPAEKRKVAKSYSG